jgi:hypothetical protein
MPRRNLIPVLTSILCTYALSACGDDASTAPDAGTDAATQADATPTVDAAIPVYPSECENINSINCLLPWPSSRYLVEDTETRTGFRVSIPMEAMPRNMWGASVDPAALNRWDGFSGMPNIMTAYRATLDTTNLVGWMHVEESLEDTSPTILFDATTGERVAHFAEVDEHPDVDAALRPLYVRPAARLKDGHRYIVAIRDLRDADGAAIAPSPYFKALRDNEALSDPSDIETRREYFDDNVFGVLAEDGIARNTLIEAWDFRTASGETVWGELVGMRDDMLTRLGDEGLGCSVTNVTEPTESEDANVFRRVEGTYTVPLYGRFNQAGAPLNRDADGVPQANGTVEVPFSVIIPRSVVTRLREERGPARIMQYGHGLFGDRGEVSSSYMRSFTNNYEIVAVATDWVGMAEGDVGYAVQTLSDFSNWQNFIDRQLQGILNFVALQRSMKGVCSNLEELEIDGQRAYDPEELYYHGNSQGGIFGGTLAAVSVDVERFALGVGAAGYIVFMPRSTAWVGYESIMQSWYRDTIDRYLLLSMFGQIWEQSEPAGYVDRITSNPLPGTPAKKVLYQTGRYDALVANVGSDIAARSMGIPLLEGSAYPVWGIDTFTESSDSGYVIFDLGTSPIENDRVTYPTVDSTPTHEGVRRDPRAQSQIDQFFHSDGMVVDTCGDVCGPLPPP